MFIQSNSRKDKYGVELNKFLIDGIYCSKYDNVENKVENWKLYTPPCPHLRPVHYPDSIINPACEDSSLQFINFNDDNNTGIPYSVHLDNISNRLKKWDEWEKENKEGTVYYSNLKVSELVKDEYYPFDYGYKGEDTSNIEDVEYYNNVIKSRMDEVPDPRRRRLFSFILFNSEYELLDLYLAEYYEIVDYFFIYEANTTFNGDPKPLYFTRALLETDRYDKFKDKLIPYPVKIIIDEDNGRGKAFPREHLARRTVISEGLKAVHARHGDIFFHGDLDELAKPHVLARMKKCGGWEHLQAGIGGGPKSFKDESVETYFINKNMKVSNRKNGEYRMDYERHKAIAMESQYLAYSFNMIEKSDIRTNFHPNIAIFDARRSLGQVSERKNWKGKRREYSDPLLDPNFDPYQGYMYTDNTNDLHKGKGFLGEFLRFETSSNTLKLKEQDKPVIWESAWHLSSFLPSIEHIYNKVTSYSHFNEFKIRIESVLKKDIIRRIKSYKYLYGSEVKYKDTIIIVPESYKQGYPYNFDFKYWDEMSKKNSTSKEIQDYLQMLHHEIPNQVWKNPICYSYMLDRDFGLVKDLWWQVIPKKLWKTIRFETLDSKTLNKLMPNIFSDLFKKEMLEEMAKENYDSDKEFKENKKDNYDYKNN
ncbi:hypothetical protein BCR32DRAFT_327724 [Anaeromyces robustus]|uniref:Glycosyltransferase family 17 protein n=1 Tax=Anaeromyces robustus TaxID=1754192 RepID=A0A1Y1X3M8_9FUNG|nr:hypothetical protein BCR32DRAFT_327724 [Anaeromyces robustus]|eukprot:ORX80420.1 hypothetical protein BCR32DRAFT_327724 [Anaeromyces robustus]